MPHRILPIVLALLICAGTQVHAGQAADFLFSGAGGRLSSLKSVRGQPSVLLIATGPDAKLLRSQVDYIEREYREFASRNTVFFAAFATTPGRVASNIPFALASDGASVAKAYGAAGEQQFLIVVIGPDGSVNARSGEAKSADWIKSVLDSVPSAAP